MATQDSDRRVFAGHLRIVDGRIDAIVPAKTKPRTEKNAQVIDARGLHVLPGFVQTHLHLCQTLFRNLADDLELLDWLRERIWVYESRHTPFTLRTSARLGIAELLASGTTCILDMGTVRHTEEIFKAVQETGIRANIGKCLMDHPAQTPAALREGTAQALQEAQALYARWNGAEGDRIRASFAPRFAISCTESLLRAVADLSRTTGAVIHTHASENQKEIELVREMVGASNIEYFHRLGLTSPRLVLAHGVWLSTRERELLAQSGTHVTHCPSSNLKLASGIAPIPDLLKRGINVALGADGAPCNNTLDAFQEMRMAALIHKPAHGPRSMRAHEVLDMATRAGAKALGWESDIGSIELGKRADLVAVDLSAPENAIAPGREASFEAIASSVVYSSSPTHVKLTWVDGRLLYDARTPRSPGVRTIPREELLRDVARARKQILASPTSGKSRRRTERPEAAPSL